MFPFTPWYQCLQILTMDWRNITVFVLGFALLATELTIVQQVSSSQFSHFSPGYQQAGPFLTATHPPLNHPPLPWPACPDYTLPPITTHPWPKAAGHKPLLQYSRTQLTNLNTNINDCPLDLVNKLYDLNILDRKVTSFNFVKKNRKLRKCRGGRRKQKNVSHDYKFHLHSTHSDKLPKNTLENKNIDYFDSDVSLLDSACDLTTPALNAAPASLSSLRPALDTSTLFSMVTSLAPTAGQSTFANSAPIGHRIEVVASGCGRQTSTPAFIGPLPPPSHSRSHRASADGPRGHCLTPVARSSPSMSLSVGLFNARSVGSSKKRSDISAFLLDNDVDIMLLTETWLRSAGDEAKIADLAPSGYFAVSIPRPAASPCTRGGGIAFIIKDSLKTHISITSSFPLEHCCFEAAQLSFCFGRQRTNFICVYRPPPNKKNKFTDNMFFEQFSDFLENSDALPGKNVYMGDFNFHFELSQNPNAKKLCDLVDMFHLFQYVSEPTHIKGHLLDLVLCKPSDCLDLTASLCHDLQSDHTAILCRLNVSKPRPLPSTFQFRPLKKINSLDFKNDLSDTFSDTKLFSVSDYNYHLTSILDKHAPLSERRASARKPTPWFQCVSEEFTKLKRERRRAERRWLKSKLTVHKQIYDSIKLKISHLIDTAKTRFYSSRIQSSTTCKQLFSNLNTILGKTFTSPLPSTMTSSDLPWIFADYFSDKIKSIRANFPPPSNSPSPHSPFTGNLFNSFQPVTENDVTKIIWKMPPKSCDLDPLPTTLLLEHLDVLIPSITSIINASLLTGSVPSDLKIALVKPLLKKLSLDKEQLKNYRPVSNLPFLSKVLEKVVLSQLLSHLQSNNLSNPFQSAYRTGHSTETVLLRVVNDILTALDNDKLSVLLLLDLSAAFDTIDHDILLSRLHDVFGIRSTALLWFSSYLTDRKQYVKINGSSSPPAPLQFGVPQGSVLGPVLFVLYTTPLSQLISQHSVNHQLFADDTQLLDSATANKLTEMMDSLRVCTDDIKNWMTQNQLKLNDEKTESLLFAPPRSSASLPSFISLSSCHISFSSSARNLGFIFDSNLSMTDHIKKICQTAYYELKRISSIRHLLTDSATKTLVTSCVLSRIDYCNCLLIGSPKSVIYPLQKIQNSAARLVLKASRFENATSLLFKLHWLPVSERIKYKTACICYGVISNSAPVYLSEILHLYSPSRTLRSSTDTRLLCTPTYHRKIHGFRSFACFAPSLWNSLPSDLRHSSNSDTFKSRLKTYLFSNYFL